MMDNTISRYGLAVLAALALGAWCISGGFLSTPSRAASGVDGYRDPAPQQLRLAQAEALDAEAGLGLPGGASSLNETYKDWRVLCVLQDSGKRCVFSQILARQDGVRMLAIEMNAPRDDDVLTGTLVLPFGLAIEAGVTLQIDEGAPMPPMRFRTCLAGGCIIDIRFEASVRAALREGTVLKVNALADGGTAAPFTISLQGFGTALDRVAVLSR